jgi:hypothetical protein
MARKLTLAVPNSRLASVLVSFWLKVKRRRRVGGRPGQSSRPQTTGHAARLSRHRSSGCPCGGAGRILAVRSVDRSGDHLPGNMVQAAVLTTAFAILF